MFRQLRTVTVKIYFFFFVNINNHANIGIENSLPSILFSEVQTTEIVKNDEWDPGNWIVHPNFVDFIL